MRQAGFRIILLEPNNGGLAVARSLVRAGHRPGLVLPPGMAWMRRSRGTDSRVVPEGGYAAAIEELAGGGPALLLAGADRASEWIASHRDDLPERIRTFERAGSGHTELLAKATSHAIARAAGVRVPWERTVTGLEELEAATADAPFPCVVKPELSHVFRARFGEERVFVVDDAAQARAAAAPALVAGMAMMLSEYVPGGDDAVEEAIVVRAADGSYPVRFGCRKLRQYPRGFGAASICVADPIPASMALAEAVLDEAGFVGVAGVETKRHAVTGETFFIEANVRLPTQFGLGDASGVDASRRLVAVLAGESLGPAPAQRMGVKLVFPELEARAALTVLRDGGGPRAAGALLRSYRGVRELGLLDPRDPGPLVARVTGALRRRGRAGA